MIAGHDLVVVAGGRRLVAGVSLAVAPGSVTALVGPNGAGKSTLLTVLAGDRRPDAGRVTLAGDDIASLDALTRARRRAVLPQEAALTADLDVETIVRVGRAPFGDEHAAHMDMLLASLLPSLGLEALRLRGYRSLSGGERQRVQLARVLAQAWPTGSATGARACLLDEPTTSLDPRHQLTALALVRDLADSGVAVVVVLHDLNLAARFADEIVLLDRGTVIARGSVDEVFRAETLEYAYGIPVWIGRHPRDGNHVVLT
ncbi:MAG: heme ABC transporter ATP-binding protein [Gemmatimonadaceae bacterium]|jgi:iron complex transport system ATP-binding protein|nr:heme ABC transporter ATP-binding protein [Gemmatimonadaceae bacterium]